MTWPARVILLSGSYETCAKDLPPHDDAFAFVCLLFGSFYACPFPSCPSCGDGTPSLLDDEVEDARVQVVCVDLDPWAPAWQRGPRERPLLQSSPKSSEYSCSSEAGSSRGPASLLLPRAWGLLDRSGLAACFLADVVTGTGWRPRGSMKMFLSSWLKAFTKRAPLTRVSSAMRLSPWFCHFALRRFWECSRLEQPMHQLSPSAAKPSLHLLQ